MSRILLEDGPFAGEYVSVTPETWRAGVVLVPERIETAPAFFDTIPDVVTLPRVGSYVRRKYGSRLHGFRYRWMWNGWQRG